VKEPSAGKLEAGNAYDQSPPASDAVWKTSLPLPNEEPFQ
jgi:hypothetical protein